MRAFLIVFCWADGGTNVDNWTFEALVNVVTEFQQSYYDTAGSGATNASHDADWKDVKAEDDSGEVKEDLTLPRLITRDRASTAGIVATPINFKKV